MTPSALEDVAFLSRSEHRADILNQLTKGGQTRPELREEIGASQPTLGRILSGFEERGWVSVEEREYHLTAMGELLAEDFSTLLDTAETIGKLSDVIQHLPFDDMDFDLSRLKDATVTTAQRDDALAHMRRQDVLADRADHVRTLCSSFSPAAIQAQRDRILNGDHTGEAIVTGQAIDRLTEEDDAAVLLQEVIDADAATFYRYDGSVPVMLGLYDEVAGIIPLDDEGLPCKAFIESKNQAIREWVQSTINAYKAEATKITAGDLPF